MQRIDINQGKPRRLNITVSDEQFEFVQDLIDKGEFDSAADYVRYLLDWAMQDD